jgi:Fuc2NAc and GlcNAc transferase
MTTILWLLPLAACVSFGLTWLVRRYAWARQLVDVPNDRSSHLTVTARGGGMAIVLTFLCGLAALYGADLVRPSFLAAVCGGGGLVALTGFVDDHRHIAALWRLLSHLLAVAWALYWLDGASFASTGGLATVPPWLVNSLAAVCMIWLVNLYNFMVGIDGIASIEAITVSFGGVVILLIVEPATLSWAAPALLIASVAGFLYWNYPPARIFMGDAGSGFLGFVLAVFCVQASWIGAEVFSAWLILLGVFIVDASVTLLRRVLRGYRMHEAHRSHAYQYASRVYGAHKSVALAVGAINLIWLLPLASLVAFGILDWAVGLLTAYTPLVWLAFKLKSGAEEQQNDRIV